MIFRLMCLLGLLFILYLFLRELQLILIRATLMVKLQKYQLPKLRTFEQHFLAPFDNPDLPQDNFFNLQSLFRHFLTLENTFSRQAFYIRRLIINPFQFHNLTDQNISQNTYWPQCQPLTLNQRKEMHKMLVEIQVNLLNITQSNKSKLSTVAHSMVQESGCLSTVQKKFFWQDVSLTSFKENQFKRFHKHEELSVLCLRKEYDYGKQIPQNLWQSLKEVEMFFEMKCLKAKEK